MPTKDRREDELIRLFVSEYDNGQWRDAALTHPDHDHDGGVDGLVTRPDGRTLAIEHTLIEFFIGERRDYVRFTPFLGIEQDMTLALPGKIAYVNVPSGVNQTGQDWNATADALHDYLRACLPTFPTDRSTQICPATAATPEIILDVLIIPVDDSTGTLHVRRYGDTNVGASVEKAIAEKLPKLMRSGAGTRILMAERTQMTMPEAMIYEEFDARLPQYPDLASVDVWITETIGYDQMPGDGNRGFILFRLHRNGAKVEDFALKNGHLLWRHRKVIDNDRQP